MPHRIRSSVIANGFSQATIILTQFATVPILLSSWGTELYGSWILLQAWCAYLSLIDIGLVSAAGNRMSIKIVERNSGGAIQTFKFVQTYLLSCIAIVTILGAVSATFISGYSASDLDVQVKEKTIVAVFLSIAAVLSIYQNLLETIFRSSDKVAIGIFWTTTARLLEWLAMIGSVLAIAASPARAAFAALITRILFIAFMLHKTRRTTGTYVFGRQEQQQKKNESRSLLHQALVQLTFTASSAMNVQGVSIAVGSTLGAAALAEFTAMRTLARAPIQAFSMLTRAVWPKITILYAERKLDSCSELISKVSWYAVIFSALFGVGALFFGEIAFNYWTKGHLNFREHAFYMLCGATATTTLGQIYYVAIAAGEKATRFAVISLLVNITLILTLVILNPQDAFFIAMILLVSEAAIAILALQSWLNLRQHYA